MRAKQENKLSMYYAVQKVCKANNLVWNGLPAFVTAFGDYETNIGKIEDALGAQEKNITGVSQDKDAIEDSMIDKALEVANAVFAYASDKGDFTLKGKVDFSRSDLKQVRDSFAMQRCQIIKDEATLIVAALASYGVTANDLKTLQTRIDAFGGILAAPRTAITERKGATDEIGKLLRKVDGILTNKLDKLVEKFKVPSPEFYRLFFDARKIVNIGTRHEEPPTTQKPAA
jgi:hypothetical protein